MYRWLACFGVLTLLAVCVGASAAPGARRPPPFAQVGNYRPSTALPLRDSQTLKDNKVGTALGSFDPGYANSGVVYPLGFKWAHLSFADDVLNWQNVERTPGVYSVDPGADRAISDYAANGTNLILCLGVGEVPSRPTLGTREQVDAYLAYVRFMVAHFKGRVGYYEILNEPDTMLTAEQYVEIVERAVPLIRADDPSAKIIIGAGAGVWRFGYPGYGSHGRYSMNLAYLKAVFGSPVTPLVDVLTWHGMYGNRADDPYYRTYPQTVAQLERVAREHGFTGQFMAGEMQWRTTADPIDTLNPRYSETIATKYLLRTTVLHRGLDLITIIAPTGVHNPDLTKSKAIRANNNILAGATPGRVRATILTKTKPIRSYSFTRPNGERLLALWADGLPHNKRPGTPATLTFPGQAGRRATVLDPLRRRQQKLVTTNKNGNLVIRGFLVRDYPIFIRLSR